MQKNLVIVESPAKAKTIEKFLGKDFKVMSSYGHIRDLKKREMSVNTTSLEPEYEIPDEKQKLVRELKSNAQKAAQVLEAKQLLTTQQGIHEVYDKFMGEWLRHYR